MCGFTYDLIRFVVASVDVVWVLGDPLGEGEASEEGETEDVEVATVVQVHELQIGQTYCSYHPKHAEEVCT